MSKILARFAKDESGATAIEYGLIAALIALAIIVGAGALITEGKRFERGSLIVGAPAKVVRQVTDDEKRLLRESAAHYAEKARRYAAELAVT